MSNEVIHECMISHEWIIVWLQVIYIWYLECQSSCVVYYIEFILLFVLIRSFKKEIHFFVCQTLNYIFNCDATQWILIFLSFGNLGLLWSWSYCSWIYNYLWSQYLSPLKLCVWIPLVEKCTRYNIMWSNLSVTYDRSVVYSGYSSFFHQKLTATII
jgi:hypothetical protein